MTSGDSQRLTGDQLATAGDVARPRGIDQDAHGRPIVGLLAGSHPDRGDGQARAAMGWPGGGIATAATR